MRYKMADLMAICYSVHILIIRTLKLGHAMQKQWLKPASEQE